MKFILRNIHIIKIEYVGDGMKIIEAKYIHI